MKTEESKLRHISIYVASRASIPERSAMWRALRDSGVKALTWIGEAGEGQTADFTDLWVRIQDEILCADGLILYAHGSDFPLKGALVEVGMALGMGHNVAVVLDQCELEPRSMRPLGSWAAHPLVKFCKTIEDAVRHIEATAADF